MKLTLKSLLVLALACVLLTYSGCGKHHDTPVPVTDTQIDALSKNTWKASTVTLDGNAQTTYSSFVITFSGTHGQKTINYAVVGRPALSPWPASGTMTFDTTTPQSNLVRNDAGADPVKITYSLTSTQLILHFSYVGAGFAARVANTKEVEGDWIFTLIPG